MRALAHPTISAEESYSLCVAAIADDAIRNALKKPLPLVGQSEAPYKSNAADQTLWALEPQLAPDSPTGKLVTGLYKGTFSRKGSKARRLYDDIRMSAPGGVCPLCSHRDVKTLDHYLEKARHPLYAVAPLNLVPSCTDCNKARSTKVASNAAEQTFHPYFDNNDDETWLRARLFESSPMTVGYFVITPSGWSNLKQERARFHFRQLALGSLYSAQAATELSGVRHHLVALFDRLGSEALRIHLLELAESRRMSRRNSWQGALYTALAGSAWFYGGGLRNIASAR